MFGSGRFARMSDRNIEFNLVTKVIKYGTIPLAVGDFY
jgi:hypothetical protein